MKRVSNLKKVLILAGIYIFCSCNPFKYHKITITIDDNCTLEQQTVAYEVINKRVSSIWRVKEKTDLIDGKFDLIYSGQDSILTQILTDRGEVYITEMYQQNEIQSPRDTVYKRLSWLMENIDHKPLWQIDSYQIRTPNLINVPLQQVLYIDSIFNSYQRLFPADISFAWTAKPNRESFFNLLPLKTSHKLSLNPSTVKNCNIYYRSSHPELYIELEKGYIEEWASMTRDNISRCLAIVMDGKVLMYPTVQSEIVGGKLTIVGDFDNNELSLIKSVILGGVLDCKAQIINQ